MKWENAFNLAPVCLGVGLVVLLVVLPFLRGEDKVPSDYYAPRRVAFHHGKQFLLRRRERQYLRRGR